MAATEDHAARGLRGSIDLVCALLSVDRHTMPLRCTRVRRGEGFGPFEAHVDGDEQADRDEYDDQQGSPRFELMRLPLSSFMYLRASEDG